MTPIVCRRRYNHEARLHHIIYILTLLLPAACGGRYEAMRLQLDSLQALNQADSLLTDDSLALALAHYFDRHGTANDRMEAHYLLGRTYADRGEAPRAIDEYHAAADCADTTSADCDYRLLSKVYGQLGSMLYAYGLISFALPAYQHSSQYANLAQDTILGIIAFEQKAKCYYEIGKVDSAEWVIREAYRLYLTHGDTLSANTAVGPLAYICIQKGLFEEALNYIHYYEQHSHVSLDTIANRDAWHLFQVQKGFYFLGTKDINKALTLFRKEALFHGDIFHKLLIYKGLVSAYSQIGKPDSVSKYALLRTEANDSAINIQLSRHLQQMMAIFDYDQYKTMATKAVAERKAATARTSIAAAIALLLLLLTIISVSIAYYIYSRRLLLRNRMNAKYATDLMLYTKVSSELEKLKTTHSSNIEEQENAERTLSFLKKSIQFDSSNDKNISECALLADTLMGNEIVRQIKESAAAGEELTSTQWATYKEALRTYIPHFIPKLYAMYENTDIEEIDLRIAMLSLLNIPQKQKATLLGISPNNLSMRRKRLYEAFVGTKGTAKDFDKTIRNVAFS